MATVPCCPRCLFLGYYNPSFPWDVLSPVQGLLFPVSLASSLCLCSVSSPFLVQTVPPCQFYLVYCEVHSKSMLRFDVSSFLLLLCQSYSPATFCTLLKCIVAHCISIRSNQILSTSIASWLTLTSSSVSSKPIAANKNARYSLHSISVEVVLFHRNPL